MRYVGFGGGEGLLTKAVADYLAATGRRISTLVIDANAGYLAKAAQLGLETLCADLAGVTLADYDLVTMRSVNHYNDMATQQRIIDAAFRALKAGGYLVSQSLSGPTERYCRLASQLSKLPILGRVEGEKDEPHITSETEFTTLMERAGFSGIRVLGYAPAIEIGPEYYWARFNLHRREAAEAADDATAVRAIDERHRAYVQLANRAIGDFLREASHDESVRIRRTRSSYVVPLTFPIFVGRRVRAA
ncbi:MAG: class I SAM-dependent methyltransferase [Geminicoccaceae bacterium]